MASVYDSLSPKTIARIREQEETFQKFVTSMIQPSAAQMALQDTIQKQQQAAQAWMRQVTEAMHDAQRCVMQLTAQLGQVTESPIARMIAELPRLSSLPAFEMLRTLPAPIDIPLHLRTLKADAARASARRVAELEARVAHLERQLQPPSPPSPSKEDERYTGQYL